MFRIQFVTTDKTRGGYVCQFCDENDPATTIRLTHPTLSGLKVMALKAVPLDLMSVSTGMEHLDRVDDLFNRVAEAERSSPDDDEDEDEDQDGGAVSRLPLQAAA